MKTIPRRRWKAALWGISHCTTEVVPFQDTFLRDGPSPAVNGERRRGRGQVHRHRQPRRRPEAVNGNQKHAQDQRPRTAAQQIDAIERTQAAPAFSSTKMRAATTN